MATRMNVQEERLATLRSVMNVIAILDRSSSARAQCNRGFDLRPLLPPLENGAYDDSWDEFLHPSSRITGADQDG